ncbi:hypothetical protein WA026_001291 [Henosepilachna vigintioctopunctata]|uniref:Uncharacterized protein n=1 Tax=Henosepilachna vigintioctopunctata TaxID=420089 RepID=A0AAW1UQI6_9CUCU
MKRRKRNSAKSNGLDRKTLKTINRPARTEDDRLDEMLKICLQKVCQLQNELERTTEGFGDPEAEGYATCALETLRFLSDQGLPSDHPIVRGLTDRLLRK